MPSQDVLVVQFHCPQCGAYNPANIELTPEQISDVIDGEGDEGFSLEIACAGNPILGVKGCGQIFRYYLRGVPQGCNQADFVSDAYIKSGSTFFHLPRRLRAETS